MKSLLFLISSLGMWSCSGSSNQEQVITPIVTEIETTKIKLTTLEVFWLVFQKAVAHRDIKTIETLFFPDARVYKFGYKEYQEKIAKGKVSDIIDRGETHKGKKVYEFMIILSSEEEEESTTTIFFQKNDEGEFRIFSVIEAG
ncbi:MAG: hypothetical protein ACI94Y_002456 [Maribacter sp.]|jgi:hypothetical protein